LKKPESGTMVRNGSPNSKALFLSHKGTMTRQNHKVQHRIRTESKATELKNEIQELRAQNQKLRRENARLRRKTQELYDREGVTDPIEAPVLAEIEPTKPVFACPNGCEGTLKMVNLGSKRLKVCQKCHWRQTEEIPG